MHKRDYQEIAQAIYEVNTWDDNQLINHTDEIVRNIADVMFNDNPSRFDEKKFMNHALNGVDDDD